MATKFLRMSGPTQLTTSLVVQYTVPATAHARNLTFLIHNTDAAERLVTIYQVPSGGSAGTTNLMFADRVQPNATNQWAGIGPFNPGDFITAKTETGANVNLQISGEEVY